jgi:hypothetical protein
MPVHAVEGAVMQGGNAAPIAADRHLTFIDQTTNAEFDLWHVSTSPLPRGGGMIATDWSGYTMLDGAGLAVGAGEGNAARFGNLAGRVRIEELQDAIARRSYINHALTIVVDCTSGAAVYPAGTNSGRACSQIAKSNVDAPPMGARIHLAMTTGEIDAMAIPEWKPVFLRTLVIYGGIINDTGASFYFDWQLESGNQYSSVNGTDPWLDFGRNMAATPGSDWIYDASWPGGTYTGLWQRFNDRIDWTTQVWNRLEVLDPCVSTGGC